MQKTSLNRYRISVLLFALASSHCGVGQSDDAAKINAAATEVKSAIVGGRAATQMDFGVVGALLTTDAKGRTQKICTATRIAPDVILTAAHCIGANAHGQAAFLTWFSTAQDVTAVGQSDPVRIAHICVHPDYDREAALDTPLAWREARDATELQTLAELHRICGSPNPEQVEASYWQCIVGLDPALQRRLGMMDDIDHASDIALGILETPRTDAPVALLPTQVSAPLWPTQAMQAVGYGAFDAPTEQAKRGMRHVGEVPLDAIGNFALQVGFANAQLVFGDSGGPLFVAQDAALEIRGIATMSLVDAQGRCQGPTLYANVQAYTPWIRASLREACSLGMRRLDMCKAHPF